MANFKCECGNTENIVQFIINKGFYYVKFGWPKKKVKLRCTDCNAILVPIEKYSTEPIQVNIGKFSGQSKEAQIASLKKRSTDHSNLLKKDASYMQHIMKNKH